jgi:hypothetical protein
MARDRYSERETYLQIAKPELPAVPVAAKIAVPEKAAHARDHEADAQRRRHAVGPREQTDIVNPTEHNGGG